MIPSNRPTCRSIHDELMNIKSNTQIIYIQQTSGKDTVKEPLLEREEPKTTDIDPLSTPQTVPVSRNKKSLLREMFGIHLSSQLTTENGGDIAPKAHRINGFVIDEGLAQDLFDNDGAITMIFYV